MAVPVTRWILSSQTIADDRRKLLGGIRAVPIFCHTATSTQPSVPLTTNSMESGISPVRKPLRSREAMTALVADCELGQLRPHFVSLPIAALAVFCTIWQAFSTIMGRRHLRRQRLSQNRKRCAEP
jgi:hypothetical protein